MKTMTCQDAQPLLLDNIENDLDETQRAALNDHLASCPHCQQALQELVNLRAALVDTDAAAPGALFWEKFPDQVWQAYQSEIVVAQRHDRGTRLREMRAHVRLTPAAGLWVTAAAALALVVGVALFVSLQTPGTPGIAELQARIHGDKNLAQLAQLTAPELATGQQYGFAAAPDRVNFFLIGQHYAAALAYAAGGDVATTRLRLAGIVEVLGTAPEELAVLAQGDPALPQVAKLERDLTSLAAATGAPQATLFRAGGMLMNLALAVAARDQATLQDAAPEILRLRHALDSTGTAPGALRDLNTLAGLLTEHRDLSDRDYANAARLIRDIQVTLM